MSKMEQEVIDVRRCPDCKKVVINVYHSGSIGGFLALRKMETVIPYKHYYDYKTEHGGYYCLDCYEKLMNEKGTKENVKD